MAATLGLGLAALGRPGYINLGHGDDVGDTSVDAMAQRCHDVLDAAYARGIRWFDAARSYGRAEEFLASWLASRAIAPGTVTVSSKWGYRYTASWNVHADKHEVKDHSRSALDEQIAQSRGLLGTYLDVYQVHSVTPDSPLLDDAGALARLGELRDDGLAIGLSISGPHQRETLQRALAVRVDGLPLFTAVQATWNLLEREVEPALRAAKSAGLRVILKEALANGRLADRAAPQALRDEAARLHTSPDAVALAIALRQPFADVVLSGAVTHAQLEANARAVELDDARDVVAPETATHYWSARATLAWN